VKGDSETSPSGSYQTPKCEVSDETEEQLNSGETGPTDIKPPLAKGLFCGGPIPKRVSQCVPLKIVESSIPKAGRGLAVEADVKAGDLIFSIPQPLLNIVSSIWVFSNVSFH
jgi:hypothetical protein